MPASKPQQRDRRRPVVVRPFAVTHPDGSAEPHCRLLFGAGIHYGRRDALDEPAGSLAVYLFRHRYLHHRTRCGDRLLEHYRLSARALELHIGHRVFCARLAPNRVPTPCR